MFFLFSFCIVLLVLSFVLSFTLKTVLTLFDPQTRSKWSHIPIIVGTFGHQKEMTWACTHTCEFSLCLSHTLTLSHNHTIIQPPQEADVVRGKKLANGNDQTVAIPSSFLLSLYLSSCSCPRYLMHVICTTMVSFSPQCSTISAPSDVQDPHSTSQSFSRVFDPL